MSSTPFDLRFIRFVFLLGLSLLPALGQGGQAQPGPLTGFPFLRIEPSARAAALGGSFSAVYGEDVNALFYNPALLNETMHGAVALSYLNHLSDVSAGFLAYGRHIEGLGALGIGVRYLGWGSLQGADEAGQETRTFGASDVALTVGLGRAYGDRIRYGVNAHIVYSSIESYSASALAADVGVLYYLEGPQLGLSASVNTFGAVLDSYGETKDELPLDVRIGLSKRLRHLPLLLTMTAYNLNDPGSAAGASEGASRALQFLTFGAEFQFSEAFQVRLGYNHRRHEALKVRNRLDVAGLSAGFGLKISRVRFDYAFNTWSSSGGLHQITVGTKL